MNEHFPSCQGHIWPPWHLGIDIIMQYILEAKGLQASFSKGVLQLLKQWLHSLNAISKFETYIDCTPKHYLSHIQNQKLASSKLYHQIHNVT